MASLPVTRYTRSGDVNIAYQVHGDSPQDLVYVPGWVSNIEVMWEEPAMARFLERLASFSRLIMFDKRGTGLSDPVPVDRMPTLEERMDDVRAVMDAVDSESATLLGHSEGGNMSILFSATYPERTTGLVLVGCYAKRLRSEDYPSSHTLEMRQDEIEETEKNWGDVSKIIHWLAPSRADDGPFVEWLGRYLRLAASPRAATNLLRMNTQIDTTAVLPTIQAPTLCIYRTDDLDVDVEEGRWIAERIPNARIVELPGRDHYLAAGDAEAILAEIEEFMTGHREVVPPQRLLATVLFTDVVDSTLKAVEMGDAAWRDLLARHHQIIRAEIARFRGREVSTAGDSFLATFDGPARAIAAAQAMARAVAPIGLQLRAGLHTGEVETVGEDVAGLAVHIGARVASLAAPGEVLVSRTVKDLVAGSGIEFADRGTHGLKGVPDEWQLFAAV